MSNQIFNRTFGVLLSLPFPLLKGEFVKGYGKLNTTLSGLMITAKQIDKRTYVRYNDRIATLGLSYGTVQRNGR